jgi:glycosyltransferase involved in cell wall biosynthesis
MNNPNKPLVSICIPVYNGEAFITNTIESVLSQSYPNIELVILDNASTDQTAEIVASFNNNHIRYIRNAENIGLMGNWNKALNEAEGDFIKLLPADDIIHSNCVDEQVKVFQESQDKNIVLVCCGRNIIDANGKVLTSRKFSGTKGVVSGFKSVKRIVRSGTNLLGEPGAILFKKEIIFQSGEFVNDFPYVIDLNLWVKMLAYGNLYVLHDKLCDFRVSGQSESVNTRHSHGYDFSRFINSLDKKKYKLTDLDVQIGTINSYILEILRRLFYKLTRIMILFRN